MKWIGSVFGLEILLIFSDIYEANTLKDPWPGLNYCKINNCPSSASLPHIGCNNNGSWSPKCGQNPEARLMTMQMKYLLVNQHNIFRNIIASGGVQGVPGSGAMLKLEWSQSLETIAKLLIKSCDLKPPNHCFSTWKYPEPGFQTAFSKFKSKQDPLKVLKSQLYSWYFQHKYASPSSVAGGSSIEHKDIGHFQRMMVAASNRIGCAIAHSQKDGFLHQWLVCLYSCAPIARQSLYDISGSPGISCATGADDHFQNLCKRTEKVENCQIMSVKNRSAVDTIQLAKYQRTGARTGLFSSDEVKKNNEQKKIAQDRIAQLLGEIAINNEWAAQREEDLADDSDSDDSDDESEDSEESDESEKSGESEEPEASVESVKPANTDSDEWERQQMQLQLEIAYLEKKKKKLNKYDRHPDKRATKPTKKNKKKSKRKPKKLKKKPKLKPSPGINNGFLRPKPTKKYRRIKPNGRKPNSISASLQLDKNGKYGKFGIYGRYIGKG